jgi:hypothetical protein
MQFAMMRVCTFIVLSVCSLLDLAHSHGAVLFPPPRNAIDSTLAPWKGASIGVNNDQQFPQVQQCLHVHPSHCLVIVIAKPQETDSLLCAASINHILFGKDRTSTAQGVLCARVD